MKMVSVIWFLSFLALMVADVQISASQEKDVKSLRCYQCLHTNLTTDCDRLDTISTLTCPPDLPYCATIATSPDYKSSLKCSVGSQTPCTLTYKAKDTYEMTCTCAGPLCNAPFNREFRNELLNFSFTNLPDNTTAVLTEAFINSTSFAKTVVSKLYGAITLTRETTTFVSPSTLISNIVKDIDGPRAEALKHEATVPPDDDEDESEGSGSFDDVKPQIPSAPAAPSSFLPANENNAVSLHINLLALVTLLLILCTVT